MTVKVTKPAINVREELADLRKPTGIAGEAMLRAETPQEQFQLIGAGRRNLIINSAMQVAQRGTSATGKNQNGYYACDRAQVYFNNIDQMVTTVSQDTDAPDGFTKSHKVLVTTAETSIDTNDLHCMLWYQIEGQDLQQLGYGDANAKPMTVSFWVKSNVTGTYTLSAYSSIGGANSVQAPTYTINTADTWEYKTLAISGNTTRGIVESNGIGMGFYWNGLVGSQYTSGTQSASWANYATNNWAVGHTADFGLDVNDYWQITGVQLELGKVATPFEHPRSYGEELAACQRYLYSLTNNSTGYVCPLWQYNNNATVNGWVKFPVTMRAEPSLVYNTQGQTNWVVAYANGQGLSVNTFTLNEQTLDSAVLYNDQVNVGIGNSGGFYVASTSAVIQFDAEL
jgi:hypothetical protein